MLSYVYLSNDYRMLSSDYLYIYIYPMIIFPVHNNIQFILKNPVPIDDIPQPLQEVHKRRWPPALLPPAFPTSRAQVRRGGEEYDMGKWLLNLCSLILSGWWFGGTGCSYIGNVIIPIDSHFSEGLVETTNQMISQWILLPPLLTADQRLHSELENHCAIFIGKLTSFGLSQVQQQTVKFRLMIIVIEMGF